MEIIKRSWQELQAKRGNAPEPPAMSDEEAARRAALCTDAMPADEAFWQDAVIVRPKRLTDERPDCPEGMDWR